MQIVCVLINKRSLEPLTCLDPVLERQQSFLVQIVDTVALIHKFRLKQ